MANDVARAYFNAPPPLRQCLWKFVKRTEGTCGGHKVSMYGMGSAARIWQTCCTDRLCNCVVRRNRGNTCMLEHPGRDIVVMVHGDAQMPFADIEDLIGLASMLHEKSEITTDIIGHSEVSKKHIMVLNRSISIETRWVHVQARCQTFRNDCQGARAARCENTDSTSVRHPPRV